MNDEDIAKLAARLTTSLATKDDIRDLKGDINGLKVDIKRLEVKIDKVDQKADTILQFAEAVDEIVDKHEKKLRRIESIPVIAHEIRKH